MRDLTVVVGTGRSGSAGLAQVLASLPRWLDAAGAQVDGGRQGVSRRLPPDLLAEVEERCGPGTRAVRAARGAQRVGRRNTGGT